MSKNFWLTPPDLYRQLDEEYDFDFDPCPYPKPENYDGLEIAWGKSNYVNPPFHRVDGKGPTAFVRKAIEESKNGKRSVLVLPVQSYVNLLLEAGAIVKPLGRVRWLHTETKEPCKDPSPICMFVLEGSNL